MKYKLFIDPGHGGTDNGATATNGELEKDINLEVALYLKSLLEPYSELIEVIMARTDDVTMSLGERVRKANTRQADLYLSIHHNAFNGKADGAEVIHSIHGGRGKEFAHLIMNEFLRFNNKRRVFSKESNNDDNKDYFFVIRHSQMPAVITEAVFLDSKDFESMDETHERVGQAEGLLRAILSYFEIEPIEVIEFADDEEISDYAKEAVVTTVENGIMSGFPDGTFKPKESVTREQLATVIHNLLKLFEDWD